MEDKTFTVSQINKMVKKYLEGNNNFNGFFLKGEISGINYYKSGHLYFTLKDSKSSVKCTAFGYKTKKIPIDLKEGDKIKIFGKVTLYDVNGTYQILVTSVEKEGSLGELFEKLERTKKELLEAGYFDSKHKLPMPKLPQNIGVVTSGTGAAIKDIINTAKLRYENINIYVYPAKVQGIGAEDEIIKGIKYLDNMEEIDLIIAGRGGGSVEDLWAFNKKEVAIAYFNTKTPIVSAVGHEIDNLLTDLTADLRASTPSHAVELVVPKKELFKELLNGKKRELNNSVFKNLDDKKKEIEKLKENYVFRNFLETIIEKNNILIDREDKLEKALYNNLMRKKHISELRFEKLNSLNPREILKRGYTITKVGNRVIKSVKELKKEEELNIIYHDGVVTSKIKEIKKI